MCESPDGSVYCELVHSRYVLRLVGTIDTHFLSEAPTVFAQLLAATLVPDTTIKLLFDLREAVWDTETTHSIVRHTLENPLQIFHASKCVVAVLTTAYNFHISPTEAFFTDEQAALHWM